MISEIKKAYCEINSVIDRSEAIANAKEILFIEKNDNQLCVYLGDAKIEVLKAKGPGSVWDEKSKEDIEAARGSYRVIWGDVPIFDSYDRNESTFNYIAYVTYPNVNRTDFIVEALSNRMVIDQPEDLTFYSVGKIPFEYILQERLYTRKSLKHKPIAGESRIGALRPNNRNSNVWTIEAFSAMKLKMADDAEKIGVDYIACQLRPEMAASIFCHNNLIYDFPRSDLNLGLPEGSVKLNRDNPVVVDHILKYPGYFLDTKSIHEVIKEYINRKIIDPFEIYNALGSDDINMLTKAKNVKYLTSVLTNKTDTSKILRNIFIDFIPDGIYSSYDSVENIKKRALKTLNSAFVMRNQ